MGYIMKGKWKSAGGENKKARFLSKREIVQTITEKTRIK